MSDLEQQVAELRRELREVRQDLDEFERAKGGYGYYPGLDARWTPSAYNAFDKLGEYDKQRLLAQLRERKVEVVRSRHLTHLTDPTPKKGA